MNKIKIYGRESELNALLKYIRMGKNILIKGRRGIGKTYLAKIAMMKVREEGIKGVYIDCQKITIPKDLLQFIFQEKVIIRYPDEALNLFFKESEKRGISLIILDEFTSLVRDLARRKPYRNAEKVIAHLRALISEFSGATIFTTSSLWTLRKMISGYERRLARTFDVVMHLDALRIEDAAKISLDIIEDENEAITIAELGDGVPFYTESISLTRLRCKDPYEAFSEELRRGALNELFTALFDDMPPAAREVIIILSKGPMSFEGLEKEILDDTLPYALDYLLEMDIIGRIERRKRVTYYIKDKTFGAWATMSKKVYILPEIRNIKRILSLGFESIVRELFLNINREVEITDINSRKFVFGPVDYVKRQEIDGEVDLFAMDKKGRTIIGEITIREHADRKILQLLKNAETIKQKFGIEKAVLILIVYKKPKEDLLSKAMKKNIYVLTSTELNKLAKVVGFRPI